MHDCRDCGLAQGRTQVVFGVGTADADLLFVGEGPGFNEDKQGLPFVGAAGQLLDELLASIGLRRDQVYIANVVKCRPPGNRDPLPEEIQACFPYLARQIQVIRPRIVCTLGRFATRLLGDTEASMGAVHGKAKQTEVAGVPVVVFPVFHPAAALYTPANRQVLQEDFRKLRQLLDRMAGGPEAAQGAVAEPAGVGPAGGHPTDSADPTLPPEDAGEAEQLALW